MADDALELDLVPARMLNEFVYCPRLAFIEWVEGEFVENRYTAEGTFQHRRVDREGGRLTEAPAPTDPDGEAERLHGRSMYLSAPTAGLVARIDLVEAEGRIATPIDYKRGAPPDRPERCYEPERVQLCAQALILEEHGFECPQGILYFAGARQRVEVPITDELRARTLGAASDLRSLAGSGQLPPPLTGSPKCVGCSLAPVCLPDEVGFLARAGGAPPRQLFGPRGGLHDGATRGRSCGAVSRARSEAALAIAIARPRHDGENGGCPIRSLGAAAPLKPSRYRRRRRLSDRRSAASELRPH